MPPVGHKREGQTEKYCSWREYQVIFFFQGRRGHGEYKLIELSRIQINFAF